MLLPVGLSDKLLGLRELLRLRGTSLSLYTNGLVYRGWGKETSTTWNEIVSYIHETTCRLRKKTSSTVEACNSKD
jgi:hypothetical protein